MDNELAANDPYRDMESGEKNIRPDFLGKKDEKGGGALAAAESAAAAVMAAKGGKMPQKGGAGGASGASGASGTSGGASGGLKGGAIKGALNDGANSADKESGSKKSFYNKGGKSDDGDKGSELKMPDSVKKGLKVMAPFLILIAGMFLILALIIFLPVLMIGALDYNLMKVLGFENTVSILEKVAEYLTSEYMEEGVFPSEYASSLANNGIDVGQVLANGDFVKTNVYIADIETRNDLVAAAGGFSYISDDEGELAMLYDGKIIRADDFVAEVESNPVLYAAYSKAADISTKYYYGEDVEEVYKEMELSRGNFNDWKSTGNHKKDQEKYSQILEKVLNNGSDLAVGGAHDNALMPGTSEEEDSDGGTYAETVSGADAGSVTENVSDKTQEYIYRWDEHEVVDENGVKKIEYGPVYSENATERAANLLNTAVSSGEPYLAANAFIAIEEPVQRARIDGDGPVNEVMNTLTKRTSVTYQNVNTGENETKKSSILETKNFRAVVSDSKYSKEEAQNFGRDRILKTTDAGNEKVIKMTTVTSTGGKESDSVVRNGKDEDRHADSEVIAKAKENIQLSQSGKNSEVFQTVVGGNRAIEGGSFLSNTINMHAIGAMPSDDAKIAEYHQEVEDAMGRRIAAERATKSPFDITSPYTFMGSIVHNMATTMLGSYGSGLTALTAISSAGATTGNAIANLMGSATAAGGNAEYTTTNGAGCETVEGVAVKGDLYCTSHNTPSTKYVKYKMGDFKSSQIGGDINDDGGAVEGSGLYEFIHYGMDRYATVGVKNAEVCERYKEDHGTVISIIGDIFAKITGSYDACKVETDDEDNVTDPEEIEKQKIFTGAKYTFGSEGDKEKNMLYSSYVMYNQVDSLLSGKKSAVAKVRDAYREKHPLDNSRAGVIARRSGMTKHEAEIALAYSDYLTMIANYNPANRFNFTAPIVSFEKPILEKQSDDVALNLYAWYSKETEYSDLRTRNFVV